VRAASLSAKLYTGEKQMMIVGLPYFRTRAAARRYYKPYGFGAVDVERKIMEGEIHIGLPPMPLKEGERYRWDADDRAEHIIP
jgi:hypothetical protein